MERILKVERGAVEFIEDGQVVHEARLVQTTLEMEIDGKPFDIVFPGEITEIEFTMDGAINGAGKKQRQEEEQQQSQKQHLGLSL